jgi:hypothetical protein
MSRPRFIVYEDRPWRISELARHHQMAVGTLSGRLARFGESTTGIHRALATGIMTARAAGQRGALHSPWRYSS